MTRVVRRVPYPAIGASVALWCSAEKWYADVTVTARLKGGMVGVRVERSANSILVRLTQAKILRSGRWRLYGYSRGSLTREPYEGRAIRSTVRETKRPSAPALLSFARNDAFGHAVLEVAREGRARKFK